MVASERIPVSPAVLTWARESAGFAITSAAKKIGTSDSVISNWEAGESQPTIKQLRKAAKAYGRPLAVLLLDRPPKDFQALKDFRRMAGSTEGEWSPELRKEFHRAISQREVAREIAELTPMTLPERETELVLDVHSSPEDAAEVIRLQLGIGPDHSFSNPHEALNLWTTAIESNGILVIHTRRISIKEMRGFSLSEWPYPLIALNGSDFPRPRLFTLIHELCHVALNTGGLCDLHETRGSRSQDDDLEHYCNQVAASVLMPAERLLSVPIVKQARPSTDWTLDDLRDVAVTYCTSSESLLLRLIALQKASWDTYWKRKPELESEYEEARSRQKEQQRESEGGPSYYSVKVRDLGHGYVSAVLDAYRSRTISSVDVSDYLEVRFEQLPKLEKAVRR